MQETGIRLQIGNRPTRKSFNRLDRRCNEKRRFGGAHERAVFFPRVLDEVLLDCWRELPFMKTRLPSFVVRRFRFLGSTRRLLKRRLAIGVGMFASLHLYAQGTVNFSNLGLNAPLFNDV